MVKDTHTRRRRQRQQVNNVIVFSNLSAKLCFSRVLKRSFPAHLMRVMLLLFTFHLNGGLHAVSIGKPTEQMSNFWTFRFLKSESEQNFGFPHIPSVQVSFPLQTKHQNKACTTQ